MKTFILSVFTALLLTSCICKSSPSGNTQSGGNDSLKYVVKVLEVKGMTCEGCENSIESSVKKISGVIKAEADHVNALTEVTYDSTLTDLETISQAIINSGYQVIE